MSTIDQNLSSQVDALNKIGCIRIFTDKISGEKFERDGLTACLDYLRPGDTLVIYRLDRLGRSLRQMINLCAKLEERNIKFVSLQDNLDTMTAIGRFTMHVLASLAEYNRNLILEGSKAGIEAAKKRGVKFGRQKGVKMKKPKKGGCHPTLQRWNFRTADYGDYRYQVQTDHIQLFERRESSTK